MRHHLLHLLLVLASVCATSNEAQAQLRPLPDGLFAGVRWFQETDGNLSLGRSQPALDYRLDKGWGALVLYSEEITPRLGLTIESGMWWFRNRTKGIDALGATYEQRAITLPLMLGASVTAFRAPRVNLYIDLNGGLAYTQYIHDLDAGGARVEPRTEPIYGLTVTLWVGLFRIPLSDVRTGPRFGTSFFNIGGQTVQSLYGTIR